VSFRDNYLGASGSAGSRSTGEVATARPQVQVRYEQADSNAARRGSAEEEVDVGRMRCENAAGAIRTLWIVMPASVAGRLCAVERTLL